MKKTPAFITALLLSIIACSCNHTIICRTETVIHYMRIPDYDTAVNQYVRVIRYEGQSKFTQFIDSSDERVLTGSFSYAFDEDKDYKLVVLPQNRRHTLSDIQHGHEKRKGSPGRDSEQCKTSITFTLDGVEKTQPFSVGGLGGYLSDLEI